MQEIDVDKSGYISKEELGRVLEKFMGYTPPKEDIEMMFKEADVNNDGKISKQEFLVCNSLRPHLNNVFTVYFKGNHE